VTTAHEAWFVLDTGASGTTVGTALARRLGLPISGESRMRALDGTTDVATVHLDRFEILGLPVAHELDAAVHDLALVRRRAPDAEGIVGQDVLARYDYLIDFDHRRLVVGRFAAPPDGVRMPLSWSAGRPVLFVPGRRDVHGLVLDTGADVLVMEASAAHDTVGAAPVIRQRASLQTHHGEQAVDVEHHAMLRVAQLSLTGVDIVRLPPEAWHMAPEVGLLPASLFSRVYVSARTGQAAVWSR